MTPLRLLSLFSGIGAFECALTNVNIPFELVNYCEFDKHASLSYSLIHDISEDLNLGDINRVDETTLPDFDLMTYGFPCQSFSIMGKREGFNNPTKGNLFFESMRIVAYKQPPYLIAENVPGLLTIDKGRTYHTIYRILRDLGYNSYIAVLNSAYFGVPQSRERVFIVSIRKDIDKNKFVFPTGYPTDLRVIDILDNTIVEREISPNLLSYFDTRLFNYKHESFSIHTLLDLNKRLGMSGFFRSRLLSVYGLSPTILTKELPVFFEIKGNLVPLELFRLQGFSDDAYKKVCEAVSTNQLIKQAGNSITVPVLEAIFKQLAFAQSWDYPVSTTIQTSRQKKLF